MVGCKMQSIAKLLNVFILAVISIFFGFVFNCPYGSPGRKRPYKIAMNKNVKP